MLHETKFLFKKSSKQKLSLVLPTRIGILINLQVKPETLLCLGEILKFILKENEFFA